MKTLLLFLVIFGMLTQKLGAATYYVSKLGSDSYSGTSTNTPFLTISKAASLMNAGDTCYILSGTYRETVTPAHSGTLSAPITFAAYPGATPIVSGADVLNLSWSVYSNSIYMATTTSAINQLFVDGYMMNIARWPNAVVNQLVYAPRSTPTTVTLTNLSDTNLPSGLSLAGAYMQFFSSEYGNQGFTANTRQITAWNSSTKTISWSGNVVEADSTGCLYYVYGALSLLDIPTEWYYSSTSNTLYLWCSDGATPANHIVETKNRTSAFTLDGLSYVTVNGLYVFAAGISMANTTHCMVNNCNLIYVQHNMTADWANTVPIANQVSGTGSMWINSAIDYSSQDGIRLTGQGEMVSNCVISNVDYYPGTYYAGVTSYSGANGSVIIDNTIWYSGRYCVGVSSTAADVGTNDLGYGDLLTSDGGGTYEYTGGGNGSGTRIHNNWVHNCWAGVYVDENQNYYNIYANVCYSNYVGMLFNKFSTNQIVNNTSIGNTADDIQFNGSGDTNVQLINNLWDTSRNSYSGTTTVTDNGWFPPVGTNFALSAGSAGIHGGEYYTNPPIVVSGYNGQRPDVGAYQNGVTWTPGANFTPSSFPLPTPTNSPPGIATEPLSQSVSTGQTAMFSVAVTGTSPLYFQWRGGPHNSSVFTNLVGGGGQYSPVTNLTFNITNVTLDNAGDYDVVVTNAFGSMTSSVAVLTVRTLNPNYEAAILADQPTSFWPLNEASGTVIHDLVGTNNGTCTNTNGLTLGGQGILSSDSAIYFNSTIGGYIYVPYSSSLNTPQFTVEAWLNMPSYPVSGAGYNINPVTMDNAPTPNGWALEVPNPNGSNPSMYGWLASNGAWTQVNTGTCIQGAWAYYAMTYDGTTFKVYTNGVSAGSQTSGYAQVNSGYPLFMGAYNDSGIADRFYQGGMQNVAVYSNALPASRILTHYMVGAFTAPVIAVQASGTNLIVTWNHGYLQEANSVIGPWAYVSNAISPYAIGLTNPATALYFRATLLP
jgi:hypothetical protein